MTGPRFNPELMKVPIYIGGKSIDEVKEEYGLENVIKMASNESPNGPSPKAVEAAKNHLNEASQYPGVAARNIRRKLASILGEGLTEDNFLIGNGGTDVLRMITQAFVFDGGKTVMSRTTFPMYKILSTAFGGSPVLIEPAPDFSHDLEAIAGAIDEDTRVVYLCTPNNPTGHVISQGDADVFLEKVPPHAVVIFDESYCDYVTQENHVKPLKYIVEGRNVISVRSFSKTAGLANFRVGYLIGPAELVEYIRHAQLPFHTGGIVLSAASASLDDAVFHTENRRIVIESREFLYNKICDMGLQCLPSQANFVAINDSTIDGPALTEALLQKGFIVREMTAFGLPNAVRISVSSQENNEAFLEALRQVLGGMR